MLSWPIQLQRHAKKIQPPAQLRKLNKLITIESKPSNLGSDTNLGKIGLTLDAEARDRSFLRIAHKIHKAAARVGPSSHLKSQTSNGGF